MVILGVGFGLVWLLVLALYGCWLWLCGGWFWLCPHLVVGCGHMLLLVVTTARCVVGLLDVASFGCWLWPRVLWATPAPNWQLSTGVLASWPWSPRCNLTKKSLKIFWVRVWSGYHEKCVWAMLLRTSVKTQIKKESIGFRTTSQQICPGTLIRHFFKLDEAIDLSKLKKCNIFLKGYIGFCFKLF